MPHLKERMGRAFYRAAIYDMFFRQHGLSWKVKGKILKVGVLSSALQGIELCCLTQQNRQYLDLNYRKLMAIALNQPKRWMGRRLSKEEMGHRLGLSPLRAYIEKRQIQFIGAMARAHDKQPTLPSMALGGRLMGQYPVHDPSGPPMWRKVMNRVLREAVGDDVCSDRLARNKVAWQDREHAPLRRVAKKITRCSVGGTIVSVT